MRELSKEDDRFLIEESLAGLNVRSKDLRMLPAGFQNLNAMDLSHAVSMIRGKGPRLVARVKYAEEYAFQRELVHYLVQRLKWRARKNHWRNTMHLNGTAAAAVFLYCRLPRCADCGGVGDWMYGNRKIVCPRCSVEIDGARVASGWEPIADADVARMIGVSRQKYDETWKRRLGAALDILARFDAGACYGLRRTLVTIDEP